MAKQHEDKQAMVLRTQRGLAKIPGSERKLETINNKLAWAQDNCHLLAPATQVSQLNEGTAVAFNIVKADKRQFKDGGDCFNINGRLELAKHKLDQIAAALGVIWDPRYCGQLQPMGDPRLVRWQAAGWVRHFDGQKQLIIKTKTMDLRDGSDQCDGKSEKQIRELRAFIGEHAESKAMNRVIRSIAGLKISYLPVELDKAFVVAKLTADPLSIKDPELRREMQKELLKDMIGGGTSMFGPTSIEPNATPRAALPATMPMVDDDDDDFDFEPEPGPATPPPPRQQPRQQHVVARRPQPAVAPPQPAPAPPPAPEPQAAEADRPLVCSWGDYKGKQWHELPDDVLIHFYNSFSDHLEQGKAKDPDRHRQHLALMAEALEARGLVAPADEPPAPEDSDAY